MGAQDAGKAVASRRHFSGIIANNRVTSTEEGTHLSYAVINPAAIPDFLEDLPQYHTTLIEHNAYGCNNQNALHFTHGSVGTIRNNLFLRSWSRNSFYKGDSGIGLHVGPAEQGAPICDIAKEKCCHSDTAAALGATQATVVFTRWTRIAGPSAVLSAETRRSGGESGHRPPAPVAAVGSRHVVSDTKRALPPSDCADSPPCPREMPQGRGRRSSPLSLWERGRG